MPPPMFDWTGPYAGAQLGYGFGNDKFIEALRGAKPGSKSATLDGLIVGGTAGYNMMMNSNIVLGIEGDFAYSGIHSNSAGLCMGGCQLDVNWFGTARARLGYAMGDTMPYLTGGVAAAGLDAHDGGGFTFARDVNVGWTAGAGIEHAFSSSVTGKIEYLYTDLGRLNFSNAPFYTDVKFSLVRVGVDFHF